MVANDCYVLIASYVVIIITYTHDDFIVLLFENSSDNMIRITYIISLSAHNMCNYFNAQIIATAYV